MTVAVAVVVAPVGAGAAHHAGTRRVFPFATLRVPGDGARARIGIAAAISSDGATIVAGAKPSRQGKVYIFTRPTSGWITTRAPQAVLSEPNPRSGDEFGSNVAISAHGRVIVAASYNGYEGTQAFVFVRPQFGWRSTSHATAVLTNARLPAGAAFGYSIGVSGDGRTVAVGVGDVEEDVYVARAHGWKNASRPSAVLMGSQGGGGNSSAVDATGRTVVVGNAAFNACSYVTSRRPRTRRQDQCSSTVDTYARPKMGWRGTLKPTSDFSPSSPTGVSNQFGAYVSVSDDGSKLLAGDSGASKSWVYTKPASGWNRPHLPHVDLAAPDKSGGTVSEAGALSGDGTIAAVGVLHAYTVAYLYREPHAGWRTAKTPCTMLSVHRGGATGTMYSVRALSLSRTGTLALAGGVLKNELLLYRLG
ncbi:MAG TPA: hypothetical protein VG815_09595 [Chloroflexota bacterium]|nr:hypothetical protein [Chloroflexota bacterium]